jgi:hypothetical protein
MRLLFVQQNFPGQYRHLAAYHALVSDACAAALRAFYSAAQRGL